MSDPNFVNPFLDHCGMELMQAEDGLFYISAELKPEHMNPYGQVHGGYLFTMIDSTAGYNVRKFMKRPVTLDSNIHYFRNVAGGRIHTNAAIVKKGRQIAIVRAQIMSEDGKILAEGDITYIETAKE